VFAAVILFSCSSSDSRTPDLDGGISQEDVDFPSVGNGNVPCVPTPEFPCMSPPESIGGSLGAQSDQPGWGSAGENPEKEPQAVPKPDPPGDPPPF
jgi:hypothetical protein